MRRGEYGYDAPYAPAMFAGISLVTAAGAAICWRDGESRLAVRLTLVSVFFAANVVSFLHTTRRGKFLEWARILDGLQLRGDERVLDMGCGRGAVLTAVARRLTTGRITGIDIWNTRDQSGNAKDVTERNADLEGVADRVEIETGDMRTLSFPDATFDLVVSSLAIHNIPGDAERRKAVAEGFRVLKPGGRMVVADIRATGSYEDVLRTLGASDVERTRLGWRFWWGNPFASTTLLTASKPPAGAAGGLPVLRSQAETADHRHAVSAQRLDRLRQRLVGPLCTPSFLAGLSWGVLVAAQAAGWHGATRLWSLACLVATASTLASPVCVAVAAVLTAISSRHRPFEAVRKSWMLIGAAAGSTALAMAALARHTS